MTDEVIHATTVLCVRRDGSVAMAGVTSYFINFARRELPFCTSRGRWHITDLIFVGSGSFGSTLTAGMTGSRFIGLTVAECFAVRHGCSGSEPLAW